MITKNPMQLKAFIKNFDYAKDISFGDVCDTVQRIMDSIAETVQEKVKTG